VKVEEGCKDADEHGSRLFHHVILNIGEDKCKLVVNLDDSKFNTFFEFR
jgi:hypothetical protein